MHANSPGERADNPSGRAGVVVLVGAGWRVGVAGGGGQTNAKFSTLIIQCKFLPLVFNTYWENDFSIFSHTNIQMHWDAHIAIKKVKCQPRIIIWTNLVDLESPILIPRFSLRAFLVLEKNIFKCFNLPYMDMTAILINGLTIFTKL